jgi:putative Holliday junction resolvase
MKSKTKLFGDILALDLGEARTGVARLHTVARIAEPLNPILHKDVKLVDGLKQYILDLEPVAIVVGLPRGLDGQETQQTRWAWSMIEQLNDVAKRHDLPIFTVDEAASTIEAERRIESGQSLDSVAAGVIAETWATELAAGKDVIYDI